MFLTQDARDGGFQGSKVSKSDTTTTWATRGPSSLRGPIALYLVGFKSRVFWHYGTPPPLPPSVDPAYSPTCSAPGHRQRIATRFHVQYLGVYHTVPYLTLPR